MPRSRLTLSVINGGKKNVATLTRASVTDGDGSVLPTGAALSGAGVMLLAQIGADPSAKRCAPKFRRFLCREMSGIAAVCAAAAIVGGWWTAGPLNHGRLIMAAQSWLLNHGRLIMAAQS